MRDRQETVFANAMLAIDPTTARAEENSILAEHGLLRAGIALKLQRQTLTEEAFLALARHETGHAIYGHVHGGTVIGVWANRFTGAGLSQVSGIEPGSLDDIVMTLSGPAAEVRGYPAAIHRYSKPSHDLYLARRMIDEWNQRAVWPPITCRGAAKLALDFVDAHERQLRNMSMVLADTGDMPGWEFELFARCEK